jgi:hypothetical protein
VVRRALAIAAGLVAPSCGTDFESPDQVLDLRILAITADPPEQVARFDVQNPTDVDLVDVEVCGLVADPGDSRRLSWTMTACPRNNDRRCNDPEVPYLEIGFGTIDDPDEAPAPVELCAVIPAGAQLLQVLEAAVSADDLLGFSGVVVAVELMVMPEGGSLDQAVFASKRVLYAPKIPDERVGNRNPTVAGVRGGYQAEPGVRGQDFMMPLTRCADPAARPLPVRPGQRIGLEPIEPDGVRETYVLPTFDGGSREFTENLSYAWYATAGNIGARTTGGPKDGVGVEPELDTTWTAPVEPEVIGDGLDVALWLVQRDERSGLAWFDMCARVEP